MKNLFKTRLLAFWLIGLMALAGCSKDKEGNRLLFSVEDDIALGNQVAAEVDSTYRAQGKLIDRSQNPQAYQHLDKIVNNILNSGKVTYRTEFPWKVTLIREDETQNAFATPGGHIYVFTGIIKYLDSLDHFAGVIGHEIAHSDKRHSSKQLQKQYGISVLLSLVLGDNPNMLAQVAANLATLSFSRDDEREADAVSVVYLSGTSYACNGAAGFFQKLISEGQSGGTPEFISTHPNPGNRVEDINKKAQELGCDRTPSPNDDFTLLKRSLGF